ncbi:MAG: pseudouridine synthase [Blastocatellia bacterium]
MDRLLLFNKPFRVLCQFTCESGRATLADFIPVPEVYAAGRLDFDSEGLVMLTNAGWLQHAIADPRHKLPKTYLAQVEGVPDEQAIRRLASGVMLNDGMTRPAKVELIEAPGLWDRDPPIRFRKNVPTAWLRMTITEGRNRQVRRMTVAVGHPTLRLVRERIGPWALDGLRPGEWKEVPCPRNQSEL